MDFARLGKRQELRQSWEYQNYLLEGCGGIEAGVESCQNELWLEPFSETMMPGGLEEPQAFQERPLWDFLSLSSDMMQQLAEKQGTSQPHPMYTGNVLLNFIPSPLGMNSEGHSSPSSFQAQSKKKLLQAPAHCAPYTSHS